MQYKTCKQITSKAVKLCISVETPAVLRATLS